jgi:hypothetical protein
MSAIICFGVFVPGFEKVIARADAGSAGESARSVGGGFEAQLFRGVGVQQIRLQNSVLDDDRAASRNAFAVEGRGAEAAGDGAVVDHVDVGPGNFLSEFAGQERCSAIDRVAVDAFENVFEHGACDHGIEHDRHMRGLYLARAETPQGAASGFFSDLLRESSLARLRATEYQ